MRWLRTSASCLGEEAVCRRKHKHFQINASAFPWKQNRKGPNVIWWKSLVCVSSEGSSRVVEVTEKLVPILQTFLTRVLPAAVHSP